MAQKDLKYGRAAIRRVLQKLEKPTELEHAYAEAILQQAVRNAASRPTPQAPMAAANMTVEQATIFPLAGGAPAEVAIGSEFGSSQYAQFHKLPTPQGLWLYPAAEHVWTLAQTDRELDDLVQRTIDQTPVSA